MIQLRKIEPADLPYLYRWENDASAWSDGSNHNPLSQQDLRTYIESTTGDIYRDGQLRLIIEEEGVTMGCIDLFNFDPRNRRAEVGIYVASEFRGKGVGQQALRLLEEYAFGFLQLRVLYAVVATKNIACTTLFRNAGYTESSVLPGWTLESDAVIFTSFRPSLRQA